MFLNVINIILYKSKKNKKSSNHRLSTSKTGDNITVMNTLNTIINSINQNINENVIEGLISAGFSDSSATKVVVEDNFSIVQDAFDNPVETF